MKKIIKICDCGTPLIYTFCWDYYEWYCLNCGKNSEFLGGNRTQETPELKAKKKVVDDIWGVIRKYFLPKSSYGKTKCKKCSGNLSHNSHLTTQEILKNEVAEKIVDKLKGVFN